MGGPDATNSFLAMTPSEQKTPTPRTDGLRKRFTANHHDPLHYALIDHANQLETSLAAQTAEVERLGQIIRNEEESINARRKYVEKCNHLPRLVIDSENGPICCECWALKEQARVAELERQLTHG